MRVLLILSIIITFTLSFKLKHYQRTPIPSSANVFKAVTFPQSEMQCCQICMNEMACDGVKYDGTICSALRNVKINQGAGTEMAFVDSEIIKPKTKILVLGGRKVTDVKIEVIDLEDPTSHCTSIDLPFGLTNSAGALMGVDVPFFCGGGGGNDGADAKDECYTLFVEKRVHSCQFYEDSQEHLWCQPHNEWFHGSSRWQG